MSNRSGDEETELTPLPVRKPLNFKPLRPRMFSDDEDADDQSDSEIQTPCRRRTVRKPRQPTKSKPLSRRLFSDEEEEEATDHSDHLDQRSLLTPQPQPTPQPRSAKKTRKQWGAQEREELATALRLYKPVTDREWELLTAMLPTDWTVEEVRAQIAKQKPKVDAMSPLKQVNESTKIIDELRRCMPNGKLPNVGTTKREELEHVVFDMFYKYHDGLKLDAVAHNASFNDSDDSFYREAVQNFAFDKQKTSVQHIPITTPSKRTFFPQLRSRRRSSLSRIEEVGDDFSIPDRTNQLKFKHVYRATQRNRRYNGGVKRADDSDTDDGIGNLSME